MKLVSIVGARPQFIKAAVVSEAIAQRVISGSADIDEVLVHTGQHYDHEMSRVFFDELGLPEPDHHLDVGSGSHGEQTGEMLRRIEKVLIGEDPHLVLVHGDTNSTLAGALAAAKLGIPVGHVEAGLRSFDPAMPEEINRVLTDRLSEYLFCPSQTAVGNLRREGISQSVHLVGDVMKDILVGSRPATGRLSDLIERLGLTPGSYAVATIHRAGNTDDRSRLGRAFAALEELALHMPVVVPLHPRTKNALREIGYSPSRVTLITPLSYLAMVSVLASARVAVTDSGGLQKEAYWLSVPCITLRGSTEWVETLEGGWNQLLEPGDGDLVAMAGSLPTSAIDPLLYGDGAAGIKIVDALIDHPLAPPASPARKATHDRDSHQGLAQELRSSA